MDDPDPAGVTLTFVLLFLLILLNAFFAMSEIAIITLNDNKIKRMAEEGHKKARQVVKLTENPSHFLSTIQIGITLAGFLTSASAASSFSESLSGVLQKVPYIQRLGPGILGAFSVFAITLIISYISLVLGELVPKRIAMQIPEKIAFRVIGVLLFVAATTKPFVKMLSVSTNLVVRMFGFDPDADKKAVTEEEIRMLVDVGGEHGVIEEDQKEMINNIFEFDDIDVGDIMTHRTDMVAVEVTDTIEDLVNLAIEEGYSRIPVYREDPDDIIGIIYVKDFLPFIGKNLPSNKSLEDIMRPAIYVPESKNCGEFFKEMTASHVQMAVVVDEYGGTAGIVTMEDLLEAIVGNIQDEYDDEEEEISRIDDTTFTVDGTTFIGEVEELVGFEFPEGDYDTLAGFVLILLGYLPEVGDNAVYKNMRFTVLEMEERRIEKIKIEILPIAVEEESPEEEK